MNFLSTACSLSVSALGLPGRALKRGSSFSIPLAQTSRAGLVLRAHTERSVTLNLLMCFALPAWMTHCPPDGVGINLSMGDGTAPLKTQFSAIKCLFFLLRERERPKHTIIYFYILYGLLSRQTFIIKNSDFRVVFNFGDFLLDLSKVSNIRSYVKCLL